MFAAMPIPEEPLLAPADALFYASAERRIWRFELAIAALGALGAFWLAEAGGAAAFLAGAAVSSLNFLWLKQAVDALTAHATSGATPARKHRRVVWKFLGRYALLGLAGYAIVKYTAWNIKAFCAGLFLFVVAILAEICYEIVRGLRQDPHGT